jgi:chromosome segregation ATPase
MSRVLRWINLLGVLALTVLCAVQWHANRRIHLELNRQALSFREQSTQLETLARRASAQAGDLTELQHHLTRAVEESREAAGRLASAESSLRQTAVERDQLTSNLTNWVAAVAARDERLQQATHQANVLAQQRDDAIRRFNELAERHNQLVKEWNQLQTRLQEQAKGTPTSTTR